MKRYIAAIDQGTTSTRFIVFNRKGEIIAVDQKEHRQIFPKPGWVEQDAIEIWRNTLEVIEGALAKFPIRSDEIAGLGITNQRETIVVWDRRTGIPYTNAVVWQDTRSDRLCAELAQNGGQDRFRATTGLPLATYFSGPKLSWMLNNIPGLRADAEAGHALFGTIDTWLIWNLTGGMHVTDCTNASRTLLMDLKTLDWDSEILQELAIPRAMLPTIQASSQVYGYAQISGSVLPVCGDLGDQQAALFGQACFESGDAKNTYGTGCFLLLNTGETPVPSNFGLLTTLGYKIGNAPAVYALEGSIAVTGALVHWLRDNLGLIEKASDVEPLARSVNDNGGIYFVPAFSGLFAPYWRSDARGVLAGLTRYIHRGHIARAVLEASAYQTRDVVEAMEKDSGIHLSRLKVDGGMVVNELLMQFQADILNSPVVRPRVIETTALGAAYAAGMAVGFWDGFQSLRENWSEDRVWEPAMAQETRDTLFSGWKKAITRTFDWID